ncbi:MAG: hypothetical protein SGBAC_006387, partial [Bacillariaceae sp.]
TLLSVRKGARKVKEAPAKAAVARKAKEAVVRKEAPAKVAAARKAKEAVVRKEAPAKVAAARKVKEVVVRKEAPAKVAAARKVKEVVAQKGAQAKGAKAPRVALYHILPQSTHHTVVSEDTIHTMPSQSTKHTVVSEDTVHTMPSQSTVHTVVSEDTVHTVPSQSTHHTVVSEDTVHTVPSQSTHHTVVSEDTVHTVPSQSTQHTSSSKGKGNSSNSGSSSKGKSGSKGSGSQSSAKGASSSKGKGNSSNRSSSSKGKGKGGGVAVPRLTTIPTSSLDDGDDAPDDDIIIVIPNPDRAAVDNCILNTVKEDGILNEVFECTASQDYNFAQEWVTLDSTLTCPAEDVRNAGLVMASRDPNVGCECQTERTTWVFWVLGIEDEITNLSCNCYACPPDTEIGIRGGFAYQCESAITGQCLNFDCDARCNGMNPAILPPIQGFLPSPGSAPGSPTATTPPPTDPRAAVASGVSSANSLTWLMVAFAVLKSVIR